MRCVEELLGIPEDKARLLRQEMSTYLGASSLDGMSFNYMRYSPLQKVKSALELLSEDEGELERVEMSEEESDTTQEPSTVDENMLAQLCAAYIDNIRASTQKEKVRDRTTGEYDEPDQRFMRSVEEILGIPPN